MEDKNYFLELAEEQGFAYAISVLFESMFSGKLMSEIAQTQRLSENKNKPRSKAKTNKDIVEDLKKRGLLK